MAKKKRKAPSINSSSSADLAFTLLIFFLVVTSMDTDEGLARLLPRWVPEDQIQDQEIKKRNILNVMVNKDNAILMGDDYIEGSVEKQNEQIRKKAIEFITATGQFAGDRGPEMKEVDPGSYGAYVRFPFHTGAQHGHPTRRIEEGHQGRLWPQSKQLCAASP